MAAEAGNSSLAAYCQLYRSLILLELGRLDDATHAARSALLATASSGDEPAVRTALAMIYQAAGGHAEALLEADQAYALRVQTGRMLEFELDLLWIRGTLLLDAGRDAEGQALLDEARQLLDERAGTLTDEPELRERFLGAVPLHRAIVRLTTGAE